VAPKRLIEHLEKLLLGAYNAGGSVQITFETGFSDELTGVRAIDQGIELDYVDHSGRVQTAAIVLEQGGSAVKIFGIGVRGVDKDGRSLRVLVSTMPSRRRLDGTPG
jgi:hypothetical protein